MQGGFEAPHLSDLLSVAFDQVVKDWSLPIMALDSAFRYVYVNPAYCTLVRKDWPDLAGQNLFDLFPEAPDLMAEVEKVFRRTLAGEVTRLTALPYALPDADGKPDMRYWDLVNTPVRDTYGNVLYLLQHAEDVTAEVGLAKTRDLIAQELNHRTRNVLMVVKALARIAERESGDKATFVHDFTQRLGMMARVHDRLYRNDFRGAPLVDLLSDELSYVAAAGTFELAGPHVGVDEHDARDLSLVIHELATNASKHGCFSTEAGRLSVSWEVRGDDLRIDWIETGVGAVDMTGTRGFGSKLIEMLPRIRCTRRGTEDGITVAIHCAGFGHA